MLECKFVGGAWVFALLVMLAVCGTSVAQTAYGEIESRPAPVALRKCVGGVNAGDLCNRNSDCPGSACFDRNVYNLTVAVQFKATSAQINVVEDAMEELAEVLFDLSDGQAELGLVTIFNNAFSTAADIRIYDSSVPTWWQANTGSWKTGGSIHVSYNYVASAATPGSSFAHEFTHLVFDARDEYESRPGCGGTTYGGYSCPDPDTIALGEDPCIMDNSDESEWCWGHGDPADPGDLSGGNHDADLVTEQSECRAGRSCWDQVVWSWPETILKPAGAPDPGSGGGTVNLPKLLEVKEVMRAVLVLDESYSMMSESPSRMERLKVAASDFVTLAENGTELGIVSYSTDADPAHGHVSVPIAALGANRSVWLNAVSGLTPSGSTNIGDALDRARSMIMAAGGVTSRTAIILMSDGRNNRPPPDPASHLSGVLTTLLSDGIPVYVTCTGSDYGLESQCSEIAVATAGFYVDSAESSDMQEAFVDLYEKLRGADPVDSVRGVFRKEAKTEFWFEEGARSATFSLTCPDCKSEKEFFGVLVDPWGQEYRLDYMPRGLYARVDKPLGGYWTLYVESPYYEQEYVVRAYSQSPVAQLQAAVRKPAVKPGEPIYVYAYPRYTGAITSVRDDIVATVLRPDGKLDRMVLHDKGREYGREDDVPGDGQFSGVYTDTRMSGAYTFLISLEAEKWTEFRDQPKPHGREIPYFMREARISAAVYDQKDMRN